LVQFALEDIARAGAQVLPSCSYVADYLDRHPEFAGLRA
jgi:predicted GNAT family acetyltransferase